MKLHAPPGAVGKGGGPDPLLGHGRPSAVIGRWHPGVGKDESPAGADDSSALGKGCEPDSPVRGPFERCFCAVDSTRNEPEGSVASRCGGTRSAAIRLMYARAPLVQDLHHGAA